MKLTLFYCRKLLSILSPTDSKGVSKRVWPLTHRDDNPMLVHSDLWSKGRYRYCVSSWSKTSTATKTIIFVREKKNKTIVAMFKQCHSFRVYWRENRYVHVRRIDLWKKNETLFVPLIWKELELVLVWESLYASSCPTETLDGTTTIVRRRTECHSTIDEIWNKCHIQDIK